MPFIRNGIPAKMVSTDDQSIERFYVELNFRKKKWLLNCSYNPKHGNIESHLNCLSRVQIHFNSCMEDSALKKFCKIYKIQNLIKEPTCFKNPENPTCIDLLLINKPLSLKNTYVIGTGLSNFQKKIVGVIKMNFPKMKLQVIRYRYIQRLS